MKKPESRILVPLTGVPMKLRACEDLLQKMDVVSGMIKAVVNENASTQMPVWILVER